MNNLLFENINFLITLLAINTFLADMLPRVTVIWQRPFYTLCSRDLGSEFAWL